MPYDAFISYKSEDRPWAETLHRKLIARGRTAFFDYQSLRAGQTWQPQLERALGESSALVVIWSKLAAAQGSLTWTEEERYLFDRDELRSPRVRRRPVIFVLLDASPPTLGALHHVNEIKDRAGAYPGDPGGVPDAVWDAIADKIIDGIDDGLGVVRVKTLVLSCPRAELARDDFGPKRWRSLTELLVNQGVITAGNAPEPELDRRYGSARRDWRPFATDTIAQLLDAFRLRLQQDPPTLRLRFENIDAEFDQNDVASWGIAARKLARELALIVVDPLALYLEDIAQRVGSLDPCFRSSTNALVVPALRIADDTQLNALLSGTAAAGLARAFFRPAIPSTPDSPCIGLHVRNPEELGRVLLLAVARNAPSVSISGSNILVP
jgi:hypothetical protein